METAGKNRMDDTGRNTAAGITFRLYQPEELDTLPREKLIELFLEEQAQLKEAVSILREQERMLNCMQEQIDLGKADMYGSRSETSRHLRGKRTQADPLNLSGGKTSGSDGCKKHDGEADAEGPGDGRGKCPEAGEEKGQPRRKKGCIDDVLKDLPVHRRDITMTAEELWEKFGTDSVKEGPQKVYRTCRYIPGIWYVEEVHVHTVKDPENGGIFQPALAEGVKFHTGSYYSEELLAHVFDQRFTMGAPFYRLEHWMWRNHCYIKRQPLAAWAIRLDDRLFSAVVCRMWYHLRQVTNIQIDETPTIVSEVRRRDQAPSSLCYMWNFRTSELLTDIPPVILFHFDESRGTEVLEECLPGYTGTVTSDGHSPYHGFATKSDGKVVNTGCLNHSRTRFAKVIRANPAFKQLPKEEQEKIPAFRIIEMFGKIFKEDARLKNISPEERKEGLQTRVAPLFQELSAYIHSFGEKDFDHSGLMYDALNYFKNQQPYLEGFLNDPFAPSNNSACERDNAGYAILRNNIKFIDSLPGATATADLYSLAATAKANGTDFYTYILYVMKELPSVLKDRKPSEYENMKELDAFMPWSGEYQSFAHAEWMRRKEILESGSLFHKEDNHEVVRIRLEALRQKNQSST